MLYVFVAGRERKFFKDQLLNVFTVSRRSGNC